MGININFVCDNCNETCQSAAFKDGNGTFAGMIDAFETIGWAFRNREEKQKNIRCYCPDCAKDRGLT